MVPRRRRGRPAQGGVRRGYGCPGPAARLRSAARPPGLPRPCTAARPNHAASCDPSSWRDARPRCRGGREPA